MCALVANGFSIEKACKHAGITEYRYTKWLAELPAFERAIRGARAILAERDLDRLDGLLFSEPDPQRLAIMQRHYHWKASKLISKVYGDKLDLNVNQVIDIGSALAEARNRAIVRPRCDPDDIIDAQVIDVTEQKDSGSADKQSVIPSLPDIFD